LSSSLPKLLGAKTAYYTTVLSQAQVTTHFLAGQAIPEPASMALAAGAFVCLAGFGWKRWSRKPKLSAPEALLAD
jgi:hypothetical protein